MTESFPGIASHFAAIRPLRRRDRRAVILLGIAGIAALGYAISLFPGRGIEVRRIDPEHIFDTLKSPHGPRVSTEKAPDELPAAPSSDPLVPVAAAIKAGRHTQAIELLNRIRPQVKDRPEAYLHMGQALRGKGDPATAIDFFLAAINRDPTYADAYFEYAATAESLGDLESALGGMRSFLHLVKDPDPYQLQIAQARAAIWEIEAKLGRGEWGPTRGIPPGFTADELKRDGKGVGIKMPIPGTERPDGSVEYEIRSREKLEIFRK